MSDINEEQKRLYKRAEENDIKIIEPSEEECFVGIIKEYQRKVDELQDIINEAVEYIENDIRYYNGEDIEKAFYLYIHKDSVHDLLDILKGVDKE